MLKRRGRGEKKDLCEAYVLKAIEGHLNLTPKAREGLVIE